MLKPIERALLSAHNPGTTTSVINYVIQKNYVIDRNYVIHINYVMYE